MIDLRKYSDDDLHVTTASLVAEERRLTVDILWHLHEVRRRRLYAKKGFESLFEYAISLGYSSGAAGRRVSAMKLLAQIPEMDESLRIGKVSLSTLNSAHRFFQRNPKPVSRKEKLEIVRGLEGKSRRECDRIFATLAPEPAPAERERAISAELTEIRFVADEALMEKLEKIKNLDAHTNPNPSYLELFHRLADLVLKKLDPEKRRKDGNRTDARSQAPESVTPPAEQKTDSPTFPRSRYIPARLKRDVWVRDGGRCVYRGSDGRICGSRYGLQYDHRIPFSMGGEATFENLRLLCQTHNQQAAIDSLGIKKMSPYLTDAP
jgi:5-methylcytosine-specific restriction endonuclease McrA